MKIISKLLLYTGVILSSCSLTDKSEIYVPEFEGVWNGNYSGKSDRGTWELIVSDSGEISGTVSSEVMESTYNVSGEVLKNGKMNVASGSTSTGAIFTGKMSAEEASGTWVFSYYNMEGDWEGSKN